MRYKNYVSKITKALEEYKQEIDSLEKHYKTEQANHKKEIERMRGVYAEEYIEEYKKNYKPSTAYKSSLQNLRAQTTPVVNHYLELIEKQLNNYFNAPVRTEFSNRINSIAITGLKLSDTEFRILQDSAASYMERRLLNQIAESRTKTEEVISFNANTGEPMRQKQQAENPYIKIEVPDIEKIYRAFNDYKSSATRLLRDYSGTDAKLCEFLDSGTPDYISISADSYFRNNHEKEFSEVLEKASAILPESKIKKELNENDKKLIDILIDPKYPTLAQRTVKEISQASTELAELFALDERYSQYVENGEE